MGQNPEGVPAFLKSYILRGQHFETGSGANLMLTLLGPTQLKMAENTRMKVVDDRQIAVEKGRVWLDVSHDQRRFKVGTPTGDITVFGTNFDVNVESEKTVVTVRDGRVRVENGVDKTELQSGDQVNVRTGDAELRPRQIDAAREMGWADEIVADREACDLFAKAVQPQTVAELPAEQVFVAAHARAVSAFLLSWAPDKTASKFCSYDVYVYDNAMVELFRARIDGRIFADRNKDSYKVIVPGKPITGVDVIHIKLVPDGGEGSVKTPFTKVAALGS
jgi:hypothetical protein